MYTSNSYQQKMHANTMLATEEAGTMCTDLFVLYLLYDYTSLWMTSPERSLGSNQVVLGGMMLPVSAMSMSCFIDTG